jgi:hypothetical protein
VFPIHNDPKQGETVSPLLWVMPVGKANKIEI